MSDKFEEVRILYLGTVLDGKDKKHCACQLVDGDNRPLGEIVYFGKCGTMFAPGIFKGEGLLKGNDLISIRTNTFQFVDELADKTLAAEIRLTHEANETEYTAVKHAKKARNDKSAVLELLKPLRRAWLKTNTVGRLALEVRILHYLRSGDDL